jgi:hypothetical protein
MKDNLKKLKQGFFYCNKPTLSSLEIYEDDNGFVYEKVGEGKGTRYKEIGKMNIFSSCYKFQIYLKDGFSYIEPDLSFKQ